MDGYIGTISLCAFNFTPQNYAPCAGATMAISQNQALFALIGTFFGGNGTTTFALPDLRGTVPLGQGQNPRTGETFVIGEPTGQGSAHLTLNQLPSHNHLITEKTGNGTVTVASSATVNAYQENPDLNKPANGYWAKSVSGSTVAESYSSNHDSTMASDAVEISNQVAFNAGNLQTSMVGMSEAVSLYQPSLAINYAICTNGMFPARS